MLCHVEVGYSNNVFAVDVVNIRKNWNCYYEERNILNTITIHLRT